MKNAPPKKYAGDQDQRQAFHLLHEFALRICTRYTAIEDDPEKLLYTGFARLFGDWHHLKFKNLSFLKTRLRDILISICIETEMGKSNFDEKPEDSPPLDEKSASPINSLTLPDKEIIDILRTIPFSSRIIYNMSVIDGFSEKEISSTLHASIYTVQNRLQSARKQLQELLLQSSVQSQAFVKC